MAILLGNTNTAATGVASRVRQWLNNLNVATPLTVAISAASPAVVTLAAHGLFTGDIVVGAGFVNSVAANGGPFKVTWLTANTFKLNRLDTGAAVNGASGGDASGPTIERIFASHKWHDLTNMVRTLTSCSFIRNGDEADPSYTQEPTIQSFFGN